MAGIAPFARDEGGSVLLTLRLTPRGGADSLDGVLTLSDGRAVLAARVRALPEQGAANTALLKLIGVTFGIPVSAVSIVAGASARLKTIRIVRPYSEIEAVCLRLSEKRAM